MPKVRGPRHRQEKVMGGRTGGRAERGHHPVGGGREGRGRRTLRTV